jgi:hypothetical protein
MIHKPVAVAAVTAMAVTNAVADLAVSGKVTFHSQNTVTLIVSHVSMV